MGKSFQDAFAITADERKAMAAGQDVPSQDNGQNYLYAPRGHTLTQDAAKNTSQVASFEQPQHQSAGVHPDDRAGMMGTSVAHAQARREPSPAELQALANQMLDMQAGQHQAQLSDGPSVGQRDEAGGHIPDWLKEQGY